MKGKQMHAKHFFLTAFLALSLISSAHANEPEDQAATDPAMQAMMEKWKMYSTPGSKHKALNPLVGDWNAELKHWMSADSEPEVSTGTSTSQWIYGGRFVQSKYSGESMGAPYAGMGIIGYDNLTKEYNGIWLDNMNTGIVKSTATMDSGSKKIMENGSFSCPMTDSTRSFRAVTTLVDENHYTYEMFMDDEEGREYLAMKISYERMGIGDMAGVAE